MATKKTAVKKTARKTTVVKRTQSTTKKKAVPQPRYVMVFESTEERLKYLYGSMTPQESLEILHEAGILTPSGRLSATYR